MGHAQTCAKKAIIIQFLEYWSGVPIDCWNEQECHLSTFFLFLQNSTLPFSSRIFSVANDGIQWTFDFDLDS